MRLSRNQKTILFVCFSTVVSFMSFQIMLGKKIVNKLDANNMDVVEKVVIAKHNQDETIHTETNTNTNTNTNNEKLQNYEYPIPSDYDAGFNISKWKCISSEASPSPKNKLIFVHVFKTAGSSFRSFFTSYGEKCGKGVSTIIQCNDLTSSSLNQTSDAKTPYEPTCQIKKTFTRDKRTISQGERVTRHHLQKYADIVIGHLPIGIDKNWVVVDDDDNDDDDKNNTSVSSSSSSSSINGEHITPQYITFFREPFAKYVSGRLFTNKSSKKKQWKTFDEAVTNIKSIIHTKYKNGMKYEGYKQYLTTPDQKDVGKAENYSEEQWVPMIQKNIIEKKVLVGIVEKMSDSMSLIQSIIDVDQKLSDDFLSMINPSSSSSFIENESRLSTSKIVAKIKEDEETTNMLNEILKYEFVLYDFALKVHNMQMEELKMQYGDRYIFAS